jgi:hypothetical protein
MKKVVHSFFSFLSSLPFLSPSYSISLSLSLSFFLSFFLYFSISLFLYFLVSLVAAENAKQLKVLRERLTVMSQNHQSMALDLVEKQRIADALSPKIVALEKSVSSFCSLSLSLFFL